MGELHLHVELSYKRDSSESSSHCTRLVYHGDLGIPRHRKPSLVDDDATLGREKGSLRSEEFSQFPEKEVPSHSRETTKLEVRDGEAQSTHSEFHVYRDKSRMDLPISL